MKVVGRHDYPRVRCVLAVSAAGAREAKTAADRLSETAAATVWRKDLGFKTI